MFGQSPSPSFSVRPHPSQEALTLSVGLAAAGVEAGTATYNCGIFLTNSHFYIIIIYTRHSFTSTMSSITFTLQQRHLLINTVLATQQGCSGLRGRKPKARKFPYWIATLSQACTKKKSLLLPLFCQQAQTACTLYTHNKFKKPRITAPNHNP